jgi:hypothetical protein
MSDIYVAPPADAAEKGNPRRADRQVLSKIAQSAEAATGTKPPGARLKTMPVIKIDQTPPGPDCKMVGS